MRIAVGFSIDNNFAEQLRVTMLSIIKNKNDDDDLHFYVIDKDINIENKKKITDFSKKHNCSVKFLNVKPERFEHCPHVNEHVSIVSYYRLMLPDLIPEEDKIIYLDCDIIVRKSLKELAETNIDGFYAAMAQDVNEENHKKRLGVEKYCNSGVIVFNAVLWRQENVTEKVLEWVKNNNSIMVFQDQDAINGAVSDKILYIGSKWNIQTSAQACSTTANRLGGGGLASVLHYIGKKKPWHCKNCGPFTLEYYKYYKEICDKNYRLKFLKTTLALAPEQIFSIKRWDNNYKILTVLGVKLKLKIKKKFH